MRFEGTENYVATDDLRVAVNAAIALERPLLVKGEPGTGKTVLAIEVAKALGVPLREAPDAERLGQVLGDCPSDHLIVIDTVGVNPYDAEDCRPLRLAARIARAEPLLVLPAGGDAFSRRR